MSWGGLVVVVVAVVSGGLVVVVAVVAARLGGLVVVVVVAVMERMETQCGGASETSSTPPHGCEELSCSCAASTAGYVLACCAHSVYGSPSKSQGYHAVSIRLVFGHRAFGFSVCGSALHLLHTGSYWHLLLLVSETVPGMYVPVLVAHDPASCMADFVLSCCVMAVEVGMGCSGTPCGHATRVHCTAIVCVPLCCWRYVRQ